MEYLCWGVVIWLTLSSTTNFAIACDSMCTFCQAGTCYSCNDGYFLSGYMCYKCTHAGCQTCSESNGCDTCISGWWGGKCNNPCNAGCDNLCDKNDGTCTCKPGHYGSKCDKVCSTSCIGNTCSAADGSCECNTGHYGKFCEHTCMDECRNCTEKNQCTECPDGRYGSVCKEECNCDGGTCDFVYAEIALSAHHSAPRVLTLEFVCLVT